MASFSDHDIERLALQVKESEGLRLAAYRCPAGALTVGYGHNCDASPVDGVNRLGDRITRQEAENLFRKDLTTAVWLTREALPWCLALDAARQAVLYDMCFNMGLGIPGKSGLLSFQRTLDSIARGNYAAAAANMRASRWARQVGGRAERLARQMETGEWQ